MEARRVFGGNPSDSRRITATVASGPGAAEPRMGEFVEQSRCSKITRKLRQLYHRH
jgi:hypothetical protein